jgi:hypothetical protein
MTDFSLDEHFTLEETRRVGGVNTVHSSKANAEPSSRRNCCDWARNCGCHQRVPVLGYCCNLSRSRFRPNFTSPTTQHYDDYRKPLQSYML